MIGASLKNRLEEEGNEVFDLRINLLGGSNEISSKFVEVIKENRIEKFIIINCAWSPKPTFENRNSPENLRWITATHHLIEIANLYKADFYGLGSCAEKTGNLDNLYSQAKKACAEKVLEMEASSSQVFGWFRIHYVVSMDPPAPGLIREAQNQVLLNPFAPIRISNDSSHDYSELNDVVAQIMLAIRLRRRGLIDIGSGKLMKNSELISKYFPDSKVIIEHKNTPSFHYSGTANLGWTVSN